MRPERASTAWRPARGLTLRWDPDGNVVAEGPLSAAAVILPRAALLLLDTVAGSESLTTAVDGVLRMASDSIDARELGALAGEMCDAGILVHGDDGDGAQPAPMDAPGSTFASPYVHVSMLHDRTRTSRYRRAIERVARDRIVLDLGCGSAVLAIFAAQAGARHVYAIEETAIADVAQAIILANGLEDRVTLLRGNSRDIALPELADVVVSEIIGTEPLGERIIPTLLDAQRRLMAPHGRMIPRRLDVRATAVESASLRLERERADASLDLTRSLGDEYGLDLTPLADAYGAEFERARRDLTFSQVLQTRGDNPADIALTQDHDVASWDLENLAGVPARDQRRLPMSVTADGLHNAMATSFTAWLDDDIVLTTSPSEPEPPLSWGGQHITALPPAQVRRGTTLTVGVVIDVMTTRESIRYTRRT